MVWMNIIIIINIFDFDLKEADGENQTEKTTTKLQWHVKLWFENCCSSFPLYSTLQPGFW